MSNYSKQTNWGQFLTLITVFFFWGFVAASNDILIPVFKKAFNLSQGESQLVSVAFYVAYTVGSLIYMFISKSIKQDVVNRIGYKNGLIYGLLISSVGAFLFYPAANLGSFNLMITGLFVIGLGFSLLQIVANPLAIELGPKETGSQRLIMAGGINNFGTTIGPLIVAFAIFGSAAAANTEADVSSIKVPYVALGIIFILVAILIKFSSLPKVTPTITENTEDVVVGEHRDSALKYPQLVLGMIAIFVYVGVEVSTASNLPAYMEKSLGFATKDIAPYVSLYWASLMIGRWTGSVEAFDITAGAKKILRFVAPYLAFGVFLLVNAIAKHDLSHFYIYGLVILVMIAADIASKGNPARMLLIFSSMGILSLITGMLTSGMTSVYAFTSVGLFCSTLWPCIFTLAINGLGKHTNQGSGYLIMMIMGGGIISYLQGTLADMTNIHMSYVVGIACFLYLAFYAVRVTGILKRQGINLDQLKSDGAH
ncbi:MFS transporter [Halpernia frigidisoli]|uniref:MFS transporter, FHS family, L-fucose permease n=1 Tax=Halpernia frigidisoli TaxID=1125876 RepID=A0A1I3GHL1_9FLAO|nr:MFS transporter [Halpernia frigidisoli]SFI22995.1 MFS transporter, FHS family, L-fucose permease [Halpernia frigidisoli]